jgi:CBS domain-containing protein
MPTKNGSKSKNKTVADVMTADPIALLETETLQAAGKAMCDNDIGDVIVLDDTGGRLKVRR